MKKTFLFLLFIGFFQIQNSQAQISEILRFGYQSGWDTILMQASFYSSNQGSSADIKCFVNGKFHCQHRILRRDNYYTYMQDCENKVWAMKIAPDQSYATFTLVQRGRLTNHTLTYNRVR
jgi:hypothetical protein